MNVLIVSQCSKNALTETRRVLDQFAERTGSRTWQTHITQQGLVTLRKLLKRSARRNTAVACHWIRGRDYTELLWIVGNARRFNERGAVPTNTTERNILRREDEHSWHTAHAISLLAAIAGLFHDFGKANKLFQKKLRPSATLRSEPYRHEWVSLRLFQAFVLWATQGEQADLLWLERLAKIASDDESEIMAGLIADRPQHSPNPFKTLPPLAQAVGWLIVSHHRLPKFNLNHGNRNCEPTPDGISEWMTDRVFKPSWNSPQCEYDDWKEKEWEQVWQFPQGTPIRSKTWRDKAQSLAKRALKQPSLLQGDWLQDRFSSHIARLVMMLADHCYSASEPVLPWQDPRYKAYANTDRKTKALKQKLDEHNVGVGHNALLLARSLPKLRQTLPAITRHKGFKQRSQSDKFRWQDKAYELACGLKERSKHQGFFGVNMASTGCGKTFANARIMYGLADEALGCRFNVALGLRTLTLQTGDALQERLHLESDDLAVLIGSQAVRELHSLRKEAEKTATKAESTPLTAEQSGSESAETLFADTTYIRYDGSLDDGRLSHWLEQSSTLHRLLSAPVLVSTIDHLIPATEGERGGKQIAPMLRLLTSDLVLDEPDDFDLADLPALSRLVNWAGMLGSRVLLSSATLPPALIQGLFEAYAAGRRAFNAACGDPGTPESICCAWFDEFSTAQGDFARPDQFVAEHTAFVDKRIRNLGGGRSLRQAELLPVEAASKAAVDVKEAMAKAIYDGIHRLHMEHHQVHQASGKRVSMGLVRMANINPMVAVAQQLLSQPPQADHRIHFCIYHSQHPLLVRSKMEEVLDAALSRHQPETLWEVPVVKKALEESREKNHLFIVFATSVAEVGRDHDYDWAIAEPSSMRSLIQLAGRIQRHRRQTPGSANLLILSKNFKALKGDSIAYRNPGFESSDFMLRSKDLAEILEPGQFQSINAIPRIRLREPLRPDSNLVDLEHAHLAARLYGSATHNLQIHAALWWQHNPSWCAEIQRHTPFRKSGKDEHFVLYMEEQGDTPQFCLVAPSGELALVDQWRFARIDCQLGERVQPWLANNASELIEALAEQMDLELAEVCRTFAELRLRETDEQWRYHPWFGVHGTPT